MNTRAFLIPLGILLLTALTLLGTVPGVPAAPNSPENPTEKIETRLQDQLATDGQADFIVRFSEQADLSPAYSMGWEKRGEFVYTTLKETAARSQRDAKVLLDKLGLSYRTFIAGNDLYVWSGNLDTAYTLAALPAVGSIRATRTYYLDVPELPGSYTWAGDLLASNALVTTQVNPSSPKGTLAWGIAFTNADDFWASYDMQGDGILIADISSGAQWNHPALDQAYKCAGNPSNPACWEDPSNICGGSPCDNEGVGTHRLGTLVGDDDPTLDYMAGMAPNAQWIACKGCESSSCSDSALNACADWILAPGGNSLNRPHIVNNSWGSPTGCDTGYQAKVQAWRAAGIFPAFSAGNGGPNCNTLSSPGDLQESFASGSHDENGNVTSFSSRGPSCFGHEPYTKPNVVAPGVNICSSIPTNSWVCWSGSGGASPHTAGAVALLWSCAPYLVGQINNTFSALQDFLSPPPAGTCGAPPDGEGNYTYGYGLLDVMTAAVQYCLDISTPTPTVTPTPTRTPTPTPTLTPTPGGTPSKNYLPVAMKNYSTYFIGPMEQEPNNTFSQANGPLRSGQNYFGYPDQYDLFSIQLYIGGVITVDLTNHTGQGVSLALYDQSQQLVDQETPTHLEYTALPGMYYIYIYTASGHNNTHQYTLRVTYPR